MTTIVISAHAAGVRRAVGPTPWMVLEELLLAGEPAGEPSPTCSCVVSVRDLARRLGLDKDTVARAVQRLIEAGLVSRSQNRTTAGTFARTTFLIDVPAGLHVLDDAAPTTNPDWPTADLPAFPTATSASAQASVRIPRSSRTSPPRTPSAQLSLLEL